MFDVFRVIVLNEQNRKQLKTNFTIHYYKGQCFIAYI